MCDTSPETDLDPPVSGHTVETLVFVAEMHVLDNAVVTPELGDRLTATARHQPITKETAVTW